MFSPALRHRQRILAAAAGNAPAETDGPAEPDAATPAGQEYAGLRVLLHDNLRTLKDIASHEARVPKKREMATAFAAWIDGVLASDQPVQDEIVTTNLIWAIDYRDFDYALKLARFVIGHGLALPAPFTRTPACFLTEQVAEIAHAEPATLTAAQLLAVDALTSGADMPDQVRAKLAKAIGRARLADAEAFEPNADSAAAGGKAALLDDALHWLTRAKTLDPKAGVAKDLEKVARLIKRPPEEVGSGSSSGGANTQKAATEAANT